MADSEHTHESFPDEEWRAAPGFVGFYEVSSYGRVRRIIGFASPDGRNYVASEFLPMRFYLDNRWGYPTIRLSLRKGGGRTALVHRLVCIAFHGPPPFPGAQVAHGDGSKDNNHVTNLRWATPKENSSDKLLHGTDGRGNRAPSGKLIDTQVREIRAKYRAGYGNAASLAREFGVTNSQILNIVNWRQWQHI